ncbi:MAG: hypothetical protein M0R77_06480 [Gammaproteobacteria bacterium]|nr:hypothetical protein [Gammaproteobacteria bacterium]
MSQTYDIVFTGVIVPGSDQAQVRRNLAALFKTEPAKIEPLFSGKRFVIKKGLDEATALKYQKALREAGAIVHMEAAAATELSTPSANPSAPRAVSPAPAAPAPQAPKGLDATIDPPGVVLVAPERIEAPNIDTSHLHMDPPGVVLVSAVDAPPLAVDLSGLSMAEPGVTLVQHPVTPDLQVDTSAMSLAEPGVQLVEPEYMTTPDIDTSQLSLV